MTPQEIQDPSQVENGIVYVLNVRYGFEALAHSILMGIFATQELAQKATIAETDSQGLTWTIEDARSIRTFHMGRTYIITRHAVIKH